MAQKKQKLQKAKVVHHKKQKVDPRTTVISFGGPIKVTKSDGTVEYQPGSPGWKKIHKKDSLANLYRKPRPRKY